MLDNKSDENHIVEQLFKKKLVECKKCKSDRGQKDVLITKMGLELLEKNRKMLFFLT